jgi:hypothetical protein
MRVAEVAELVDALGSGSSGGISVRVRVSPSAPVKISRAAILFRLQPFLRISLHSHGNSVLPATTFPERKESADKTTATPVQAGIDAV